MPTSAEDRAAAAFDTPADPRLAGLERLVYQWTGRSVEYGVLANDWTLEQLLIESYHHAKGVVEEVFHELCHFIVAAPKDRISRNLNLHTGGAPSFAAYHEYQACALELKLLKEAGVIYQRAFKAKRALLLNLEEAPKSRAFYERRAELAMSRFEKLHPGARQLMLAAVRR